MKKIYDVIIVGGGPIGLACAIEAQKNGLNYLIIEKGSLVNSLYRYPLYMTFFSTAERLEIGNIPFNCLTPKPGRQEALEYYRNIYRHFDLRIHFHEEVLHVNQEKSIKKVNTDQASYVTKNLIIATGFYDRPIPMNVPGENLPKVSHYFNEAHPYIGQKLAIIGANNSAVDAALECWRKGVDVTMIIRGKKINDRVKYWVKPDIENRISEGSIVAYFDSVVDEIKKDSLIISTPSGQIGLKNDFVLAMTGYHPDFEFLQRCGIELSKDALKIPTYNPDTMESNVDGIYLAGVVCGGMETHKWFIENSRVHAKMIVENIIKSKIN